jgi:hypothetical protein
MKRIWIIGLGHFGFYAVQYLSSKNRDTQFVLVDEKKAKLRQAEGPNRILEHGDGVEFLQKYLQTDGQPDWIIPALPIHLAAEWCFVKQEPKRFVPAPIPKEIKAGLPHPMEGRHNDIYVSHADFKCPADCAEPRNMCTVTQKPRKQNLFDLLSETTYPCFQSLVIRTLQLGPGIGGYRPAALLTLLKQVNRAQSNLLVSTACRCHGVISSALLQEKKFK